MNVMTGLLVNRVEEEHLIKGCQCKTSLTNHHHMRMMILNSKFLLKKYSSNMSICSDY